MAIRRPSINSPTWLFQDFLYFEDGDDKLRYLHVKWDGEPYTRTSSTFDYSNPPYSGSQQRGGEIVGQIDYTVNQKLVTIDNWSTIWRDELPLRLAINYLVNCLYPYGNKWVIRVKKDTPVDPFWVSEYFHPTTNEVGPETYLYFAPSYYTQLLY
jgi:hypothetical protein